LPDFEPEPSCGVAERQRELSGVRVREILVDEGDATRR
jgi:hypothetical protein